MIQLLTELRPNWCNTEPAPLPAASFRIAQVLLLMKCLRQQNAFCVDEWCVLRSKRIIFQPKNVYASCEFTFAYPVRHKNIHQLAIKHINQSLVHGHSMLFRETGLVRPWSSKSAVLSSAPKSRAVILYASCVRRAYFFLVTRVFALSLSLFRFMAPTLRDIDDAPSSCFGGLFTRFKKSSCSCRARRSLDRPAAPAYFSTEKLPAYEECVTKASLSSTFFFLAWRVH